jgi:DNA-binding transcriptional LysR family regulator
MVCSRYNPVITVTPLRSEWSRRVPWRKRGKIVERCDHQVKALILSTSFHLVMIEVTMNFRQCEVFRVVMEAGTVTAAAQRLHVSQPAVSKILAQLEQELGFQAFVRERRRLIPTPEAQSLYHEIRRAFISLDYLTRFAQDLRGLRQGHLVLAAIHAASSGWLPGMIAKFMHHHPGLSISLQTLDSPRVAQAVATGHADLGIAQFEVPMEHVRRDRLISVDAVCVMPPNHELAQRRVIRPADLHDQNFIALATINRFRKKLDALLEARGIVPRIQVDTTLASTACGLVAENAGIAVLDRLGAEDNRHRGIIIRPFLPKISEDLILLTPAGRPASAAAGKFAAELKQYFSGAPARRSRTARLTNGGEMGSAMPALAALSGRPS